MIATHRRRSLIGRSRGVRHATAPVPPPPPRIGEALDAEPGQFLEPVEELEALAAEDFPAWSAAHTDDTAFEAETDLVVIERNVAGDGFAGWGRDDSYDLDEPPSEEVRRDPRFRGIDFARGGAPSEPPPIAALQPPSGERLRVFAVVAALLGSGSVAVIAVCVVVGAIALRALLAGGTGELDGLAPAAVAPAQPVVVEPVAEPARSARPRAHP